MESSDGRYGWAADDPRWSDALAGGRGRLEPSPPRFGAGDSPADATAELSTALPGSWPEGPVAPADSGAPEATPVDPAASLRPMDLPQWPPPPPTGAAEAGPSPEAGLTPGAGPTPEPPPAPRTVRDLLGPPLAISAPAPPPPAPGNGYGPPPARGAFVGAAPVPSPVPTSVPLRVHTPLPAPAEVELRTAYASPGTAPAAAPVGGDLAHRPRTTRLERRVRIRSRWSVEDEFRQAARVELFSDDARYRVLFALTAGWYGPAALVYLAWVLLVRGAAGGSGLLAGLLWLAAAAVVSLAVAGLLRWASVGWRALTLSVAAAVVGGGITTIAQTLTG